MRSRTRVAMALAIVAPLLFCATVIPTRAAPQGKKAPARKTKVDKSPANMAEGIAVYQKSGCAACHAISGKGGKSGTDLTHEGKRGAAYIEAYTRNPKSKNPKSKMPAYPESRIGAKEMKALVSYLSSLK